MFLDRDKVTTIGFTCGAWDLLHPGHLTFLENCKNQCDWLMVGLQLDPSIDRPNKNKPIQSVHERWIQLRACRFVDEILPYDIEKDLEHIFHAWDINKRFVGSEYDGVMLTGHDICVRKGIKILCIQREHKWSSTELRRRIKEENEFQPRLPL